MVRGIDAAISSMMMTQRRHAITANNIANANTIGFKAEHMESAEDIGAMHLAAIADEAPAWFAQGDLEETGAPLDVALAYRPQDAELTYDASGKAVRPDGTIAYAPEVFFVVQNADGQERYTRQGQWTVDGAGRIVASSGALVLDVNRQPITLSVSPSDVRITERGALVDARTAQPLVDGGGLPVRLAVVRVDDVHALVREGQALWVPQAQDPLIADEDAVTVWQGSVERSNVDVGRASVDLMTAQRAYEANQRVVQWLDRTLEKAVNEVGRV
jgi:flagellar basal-body rod protein FlgG